MRMFISHFPIGIAQPKKRASLFQAAQNADVLYSDFPIGIAQPKKRASLFQAAENEDVYIPRSHSYSSAKEESVPLSGSSECGCFLPHGSSVGASVGQIV
jgi:hypothetical protein